MERRSSRSRGEAFVPIQTSSVPLHTWAIEIKGDPLRFPEETPVSVEGGGLSVGDTHIPLSDAQIDELSLPRLSGEEAAIARRALPILVRFVEEARKTRPPDPFQPQIDAIIDRWHETGDPGLLLDLIGLGAGSTPSGDDVLVGILAGMSLFEHVDGQVKEALTCLRTGIQEIARARTPLPSAQMLLAACDRSFPEPLLALLEGLTFRSASEDEIVERARHVTQLGHHSGIAILSGLTSYLFACTVLECKTCPPSAIIATGRLGFYTVKSRLPRMVSWRRRFWVE